ncbi:VOC family protein [Paraburkholderia elongata]|uniref:Glyoxalase n=1 Tax=Paraburkholderia elongata TaxID=2675747 RepID=A0A972NV05_9BURK|nr:VOC family protein [Paraburkholderia elongata]NPT60356.1 glyoxalase [Paraburkholderia elongata]
MNSLLRHQDPILHADRLTHVVFNRRDPDAMDRFLRDFGFVSLETSGRSRHYRGYGKAPFCVEVIPADEDSFVGFALVAKDVADLQRLTQVEGVAIEPNDGPGGGLRVRLTDPDGRRVDLLAEIAELDPLPIRAPFVSINTPNRNVRVNAPIRSSAEPSPVLRMGHVVLQTPDFQRTAEWYMHRFGFIASDLCTVADGTPALGFFRLDRGDTPADHHSLAFLAGPAPAVLHVSTETIDIDAVGQGQQHLRARGWTHAWGTGRHVLGSQFFDYWKDPAGDEWEHYADGDLMTADYPTGQHPLARGGLWAWGDDLPESLRPPGPLPEGAPPFSRAVVDALLTPPRPWMR